MPTVTITPRPTPVGFTATTDHAASHAESMLAADFGSIPPEINSARMYTGPGPDSLLEAAASWDRLATDLDDAAGAHHAMATQLTTESWRGPASATMLSATSPYLAWLRDTAALATKTAQQARATVAAYEAARAMTVPPSVVAANRALLATHAAGNALGLNAHHLATIEAQYREMWDQDSTAMYIYAETAVQSSTVTPFLMPPGAPDAPHAQSGVTPAGPNAIVSALQRLASPGSMPASANGAVPGVSTLLGPTAAAPKPFSFPARKPATARTGQAARVGALSTPRAWYTSASIAGAAAPGPGEWTAAPVSGTPAVPMMPAALTARHRVSDYLPSPDRGARRTVVRMCAAD